METLVGRPDYLILWQWTRCSLSVPLQLPTLLKAMGTLKALFAGPFFMT